MNNQQKQRDGQISDLFVVVTLCMEVAVIILNAGSLRWYFVGWLIAGFSVVVVLRLICYLNGVENPFGVIDNVFYVTYGGISLLLLIAYSVGITRGKMKLQ